MRGTGSADWIAGWPAPTRDSTSGCGRDWPAARVSLVPSALVATAGDGVAGLPVPLTPQRRRRARLRRARRAAAPAAGVRTGRRDAAALAVAAAARPVAHDRATWCASSPAVSPRSGPRPRWRSSASCRSGARAAGSRAHVRRRGRSWHRCGRRRPNCARRLDDDPEVAIGGHRRSDLRFFAGGGAWLVLAALAVSVAAFPALLAWPVLGGGALQPLATTVGQLWNDAAYGQRALGTRHDRSGRSVRRGGRGARFALAMGAVAGTRAAVDPRPAARRARRLVRRDPGHRAGEPATARRRGVGAVARAPRRAHTGAADRRAPAPAAALAVLRGCGRAPVVVRRRRGLPPARRGARDRAVARSRARWCCGSARCVLAVVLRAGRGVARLVWTLIPALALPLPLVWNALTHARCVGARRRSRRAVGRPAGRRGRRRAGRSWPPASRPPTSPDGRLSCRTGRRGGCRC